jgi:hypothetical protein
MIVIGGWRRLPYANCPILQYTPSHWLRRLGTHKAEPVPDQQSEGDRSRKLPIAARARRATNGKEGATQRGFIPSSNGLA